MAGVEALTILGLESSCDETAAAVLRVQPAPLKADIAASVVHDQMDLHTVYGGVVPEIAARAHVEKLDIVVQEALRDSQVPLHRIDLIGVTVGPGLIGGLMVGAMCAAGLGFGLRCPVMGINHLEGHALTPRLTHGIAFPYLMLLVSGGHCLLLIVDGPGQYTRLGASIDDAPGEAFDKTAKMLNLGFPGGPLVEQMAAGGDAERFPFPRPLSKRPGCDFSFSGLKTALRQSVEAKVAEGQLDEPTQADLCASFQAAVADTLARQTGKAMALFRAQRPQIRQPVIAIAGGVAANIAVREALLEVAREHGFAMRAPPLSLCGDNAAMIAWAAAERLAAGFPCDKTLQTRPRWPLDENAVPLIGTGKKGAKA